jgi:hypothetical protein
MRKTMMIIVMFCITSVFAFGQDDYKMLELVYLKPLPGVDLEEAGKLMAEHNKKFHAESPYKASVWSNLTGSNVGTWTWVMYPATFSAYDSRPEGKAHDEDWDKVVGPYFEVVANEYWKVDSKLTYEPENSESSEKVVFTVYDIKPGDSYRFKAMLEKISEVYKQKKYTYNFTVYWNQFDNKNGRDVAIEVMFDKWSFLDEDHSLKADYEEVHGEGSWWKLIEEYRDVVVSADDELSVLLKGMSVD